MAVHLVGQLDQLLGAGLAVVVSPLIQVGHLLQLGAQLHVALVGEAQLLRQLLDDDLAVLNVLDEDGDLAGELLLLGLGGLQLGLQVVQVVGEASELDGELLLERITLLHAQARLILVLLLPFSIVLLPLVHLGYKERK